MALRRFYVSRDSIRDGTAILTPEQVHHLRAVLRIDTGDVVELFDGEGNGYVGEVELHGGRVLVRGLKALPSQDLPGRLVLAAALIKSAKFEWLLQKATELGVREIIPLRTRLSNPRIPDNKIHLRLERWERIVREASKQCRRFSAPRVRPPLHFSDLLRSEEFSACTKLLFHEKAAESWQLAKGMLSDRIVLCTGPEGGWDCSEIEKAKAAGYRVVNLGPWILRAETAAIAAVSIIQYQINLQIANPSQ